MMKKAILSLIVVGFAGLSFANAISGSFAFKNGMIANISSEITAYSFAIPTAASTPTLGSTAIPATQDPVESFKFIASGNGTLTFGGTGTVPALYVTGTTTGTPTYFTSVLFSIGVAF